MAVGAVWSNDALESEGKLKTNGGKRRVLGMGGEADSSREIPLDGNRKEVKIKALNRIINFPFFP
jgi:hypothetical protein